MANLDRTTFDRPLSGDLIQIAVEGVFADDADEKRTVAFASGRPVDEAGEAFEELRLDVVLRRLIAAGDRHSHDESEDNDGADEVAEHRTPGCFGCREMRPAASVARTVFGAWRGARKAL